MQTKANAPHNQYDYWSLIVLNSTGVDNATYVQQIAINEKVEDRAIYVRKKSSNWTSWIKLEAADDKVSKTEIADFKRCIVLTQSEYDALSTTKKNRADTLYFIKA